MALELLAIIFAVLVLLKLFVISIDPKTWLKISDKILPTKSGSLTTVIYLALAAWVGYIIFQELSIIQVSAVFLFIMLLMVLGWIPYSRTLHKLRDDILQSKQKIFRRNWLPVLIWVGLALWALFATFKTLS